MSTTSARRVTEPRRSSTLPLLLASIVVAIGCGDGPNPNPAAECNRDDDCAAVEICSLGDCVVGCRPDDVRCPLGTECRDGFCRSTVDAGIVDAATTDSASTPCPADMVLVDGIYCVDRYEASRPDATATSAGSDESRATSRVGVLPWFPVTLEVAMAACSGAEKHLCTAAQYQNACQGPDQTVYAYGDDYDPVICNSIDTYCRCSTDSCAAIAECPYPHCYNQPPPGQSEPGGGCGATPHAMPTGSFPGCTNEYGVYDINGNVWEMVNDGSGGYEFRGGAYNCIDSEKLHRCDYTAGSILAKGFRCCSSPAPQ